MNNSHFPVVLIINDQPMKTILDFLSGLSENNNREWFNEHKSDYTRAKEDFEALINRLIPEIRKFDPAIGPVTAGDCVFRIYRDVRFSKDKSPYKTNMGGFITKGGRKGGYAGYYLHIDPAESFIAGGNHMPAPDRLKKIRQEIFYNIREFKGILENPSFKKTFGTIDAESLSRPPKDFPADFPDIDLIKFKSYTVVHGMDKKTILSHDFEEYTIRVFRELYPLNRFLNKALD